MQKEDDLDSVTSLWIRTFGVNWAESFAALYTAVSVVWGCILWWLHQIYHLSLVIAIG